MKLIIAVIQPSKLEDVKQALSEVEVVRLTSEPKIDARAIRDCVQNDPALTAKLLRVVNSSLYGLRGEVSNLNQAIALLGVKHCTSNLHQ